MSGDAQPSSKQRATIEVTNTPPPPPPIVKEKAAIGALCVVCGDRACSHLYYGVAACHGCKCFFWRTVKSRLNYVCRYGGTCSISTAGRNACRFCRFNRCLSVGMKMEAVKMDRKLTKRKREKMDDDETDENAMENHENNETKRAKSDVRLLISSLLLIDKTSSDGNAKLSTLQFVQPSLANLLDEPELLDGFRSEMSYRATRHADERLCFDTERRLVTWAIDWCRQTADIGDVHFVQDKIALLRSCCATLALLELAAQSTTVGRSDAHIAMCNNSFLLTHAPPPSTSFLNWKTVQSLSKWSQRELKPLGLKAKELVLLKALIVLNPDAEGLSTDAESLVRMLRERVHSALFQLLLEQSEPIAAASRLARILLLIPQLALMGVDVVEQVRVRNTFRPHRTGGTEEDGVLLWQLYGDIFDAHSHQGDDDHYLLEHSSSPTDSLCAADESS